MGGYGGASGKVKDKCYRDSKGFKVTEESSIKAAEYYLSVGMSVVFLHQDNISRPDLLVDFKFIVEVKDIESPNPSQVAKQIKKASRQIEQEHSKYPEDKRLPAKIVLISLHTDLKVGFYAISEGYKEAKRKNDVHFKTELWINGEIHVLSEEE